MFHFVSDCQKLLFNIYTIGIFSLTIALFGQLTALYKLNTSTFASLIPSYQYEMNIKVYYFTDHSFVSEMAYPG